MYKPASVDSLHKGDVCAVKSDTTRPLFFPITLSPGIQRHLGTCNMCVLTSYLERRLSWTTEVGFRNARYPHPQPPSVPTSFRHPDLQFCSTKNNCLEMRVFWIGVSRLCPPPHPHSVLVGLVSPRPTSLTPTALDSEKLKLSSTPADKPPLLPSGPLCACVLLFHHRLQMNTACEINLQGVGVLILQEIFLEHYSFCIWDAEMEFQVMSGSWTQAGQGQAWALMTKGSGCCHPGTVTLILRGVIGWTMLQLIAVI